ncbi:MAG: MBOAT family O-acyltransferase [Turicibacter sp.]
MIFSTFNDFYHAKMIHRAKEQKNNKKARYALISSIIINIGILCFFKYSDFLIMNLNQVLNTNIDLLNLPLPIGISFYTFQTMSYTIDVYKGQVKVQRNILTLATYVTLFPQLIAGPIVRYSTIETELEHRKESVDDFSYGLRRFILGLAKKVLISNKVGLLATQVQLLPDSQLSFLISWIGLIAYALHIYFDFSGYSDMAIGLGRMFGFHFLENFNYPYISKSITEFWRRWHISLGTWFRDYVYIPLGGNRVCLAKKIRNILIVWLLTGFWHGASWNFILWGLYFGMILIAEKYLLLRWLAKLPAFFQHLYALFLILIGWSIFSFTDLSRLGIYMTSLFDITTFVQWDIWEYLNVQYYLPYICLGLIGSMPLVKELVQRIKLNLLRTIVMDSVMACLFILSIMSLLDATFNPFIYFRF